MRTIPLLSLLASTTLAVAGCDLVDSDPAPGPAAAIEVVSGNTQTAVVGEVLAEPLVLRVTDPAGRPVPHQKLDFLVSGGGRLVVGRAMTDVNGRAMAWWTLGTSTADSQRVEVRVEGAALPRVTPVVFSARPTPAGAATVEGGRVLEDGAAGSPVATPLMARVRDRHGNPVPGAEVVWTVTKGGGTVEPARSVSDADGFARARWTRGPLLGTPQVLDARAGEDSAWWSTLALPAAPVRLEWIRAQEWQIGLPGGSVEEPVTARLTTAAGEPIAGAWLRLAREDRETLVDSALTDALGRATLRLVLGQHTGPQTFVGYLPGAEPSVVVHGYADWTVPWFAAALWSVRNGMWHVEAHASAVGRRYPVRVIRIAPEQEDTVLVWTDFEGRFELDWPFASTPHMVVIVGAARPVIRLELTLWIQPLFPPGGELAPDTRFVVRAEQGPFGHTSGYGRFPSVDVGGEMTAHVHGRKIEFGLVRGPPWEWAPSSGWLDGLPEGPATIRLYLRYDWRLNGLLSSREYGGFDLPVVIRGTR